MSTPIDHHEIERAAEILRRGELVAFPTETVYGLGADATDAKAVARVFELKGRPSNNPLIVHAAGTEQAQSLVSQWPAAAEKLARRFWPGPLTLVLARNDIIPDIVCAKGPTVAVRCPDHPVATALLECFGGPLVGPSANRSGSVSSTTAQHVRRSLGDGVHILDGGPCERGIESTVVRVEGGTATILRPGVITQQQIAEVTDVESYEPVYADESASPLPSPGSLRRHYAPVTPARLFDASQRRAVLDRLETGEKLVVISHGIEIDHPAVIRMPFDAESYARELYAAMHRADDAGAEAILIELPNAEGQVWSAIRDRLRRAAAG
ncbi:MAG: L-threonylcarbamoyladenylate synthase [Planctomycetota bacterium]